MLKVPVVLAFLLVLAGCGGDDKAASTTAATDAPTTTVATTTTTTTTTTFVPPPVTMPSGDPVFPGYPKLVARSSIDSRVANWYKDSPSDQLVALAPGVYTPFNPNVPDLAAYLDGPNSGDCAARSRYFPNSGGACWEGVR